MAATAALDARMGHFARLVGEVPIPAHGGPVSPSPDDLARLKSAAWTALRRFSATGLASDADDAALAARRVEAAQEEYRRVHFPNALAVFVLADEERGHSCQIYAVFSTGPECVYEAHAERVG